MFFYHMSDLEANVPFWIAVLLHLSNDQISHIKAHILHLDIMILCYFFILFISLISH
jgi:hypothetical protein